jgi:hypothetical protein
MDKLKIFLVQKIEIISGIIGGGLTYAKINASWFSDLFTAVLTATIITVVVYFVKRWLKKKWP